MASKEILFDTKAREKLSRGVDKLANAVTVDFGSRINLEYKVGCVICDNLSGIIS